MCSYIWNVVPINNGWGIFMQSSDVQAASEGKSETGDGRLSSVTAAIRLLKVFSEHEPEIGISNLAKRMGLAKSTVHRLATTLVAEGLLEQNEENGRYRLGIQLFTLGALVRRRFDVSKQ